MWLIIGDWDVRNNFTQYLVHKTKIIITLVVLYKKGSQEQFCCMAFMVGPWQPPWYWYIISYSIVCTLVRNLSLVVGSTTGRVQPRTAVWRWQRPRCQGLPRAWFLWAGWRRPLWSRSPKQPHHRWSTMRQLGTNQSQRTVRYRKDNQCY